MSKAWHEVKGQVLASPTPTPTPETAEPSHPTWAANQQQKSKLTPTWLLIPCGLGSNYRLLFKSPLMLSSLITSIPLSPSRTLATLDIS